MKMSKHATPPNHYETGYSGTHTSINDDLSLYVFQIHIEMHKIVKITTLGVKNVIIYLAALSFSVMDNNYNNMKIQYSGVVCGWAASVWYT